MSDTSSCSLVSTEEIANRIEPVSLSEGVASTKTAQSESRIVYKLITCLKYIVNVV